MKHFLTSALAIVLFVGAANAQTASADKHQRGGHMKELNLSAGQKAKLKSIHEAEKTEMTALRNGTGDNAGRQQIRDKYRQQTEAVLTPDQKAKWNAARPDKGAGKWEKGGGQQLQKDLQLTPDQQTKMAALNQDFRSRAQAIRSNSALSDADKKAQMKQAAGDHRTSMKSILTAEQASKMKSMHKGKGKRKGTSSQNV